LPQKRTITYELTDYHHLKTDPHRARYYMTMKRMIGWG